MATFVPFLRAAGLALLLVGCTEDVTTPDTRPELPSLAPSTAMAVVQESAGPEAGTVTLTVRVLTRDLDVAAYQGSLRFTPGAYEVLSVRTPEGGEGETRVVNTGEVPDGRIRFAAFAVEEFGSDVAFIAVVRARAAEAAASLETELDVVGTPEGQAVEPARIGKSRGLYR